MGFANSDLGKIVAEACTMCNLRPSELFNLPHEEQLFLLQAATDRIDRQPTQEFFVELFKKVF